MQGAEWTRRTLVALVGVLYLLAAVPAFAEDSDQLRYYLDLRYGDLGIAQKPHDSGGASVGLNLNRYLGFELSLDAYDLKVSNVSETEILGFVPQVRLRYPFWHDRISPYLLGGAGLAVTQANDARAPVQWTNGKTQVFPAGTLGGGIEYFIADNIALGIEGKYLFTGTIDYVAQGGSHSLDASSALASVGMRLFYPELHPEEGTEAARRAFVRFYADLRLGGALPMHGHPFPGVSADPENSIFGSNFTPLFGASVGANIGKYFGIELSFETYELKLGIEDVGGIGEYALFPFAVQPRLRYPLLDGALEPYILAGAGAEFAEINDRNGQSKMLVINARDITPIGTFGAGIEYLIMSNVALGGEMKYVISRGHTFQLDGDPKVQGNLDAFFLSIGLRVFFYSL